jgi:hypothetical protein
MAVKDLTVTSDVGQMVILTWAAGTDADTGAPYEIQGARAIYGAMQASGGTVGSVTLQASIDGSNWATVKDIYGNEVVLANATTVAEFSTAARYIRTLYGTGASTTVARVMLRG